MYKKGDKGWDKAMSFMWKKLCTAKSCPHCPQIHPHPTLFSTQVRVKGGDANFSKPGAKTHLSPLSTLLLLLRDINIEYI